MSQDTILCLQEDCPRTFCDVASADTHIIVMHPNLLAEDDIEQADKMHDPKGGLSAAGRKKFNSQGSNLKPGVTSYNGASTADKKRWVRWALRFAKTPRPLKKPNGDPTPYAKMFQAWGRPIPKNAQDVRATYNLALTRRKALGMGDSASLELDIASGTPTNSGLMATVRASAAKKFGSSTTAAAKAWIAKTYQQRGGKYKEQAHADSARTHLGHEHNACWHGCGRTFLDLSQLNDHADLVHTFDETRMLVNDALQKKYGRESDYEASPAVYGVYVYAQDLTTDWVVFRISGDGFGYRNPLQQATYSITGTSVTLGEPTPVVARTVYDGVVEEED